MRNFFTYFIILTSINAFSQELSIDETIDYINKNFKYEIKINEQGYFIVNDFKFYYEDVKFSILTDKNAFIRITCKKPPSQTNGFSFRPKCITDLRPGRISIDNPRTVTDYSLFRVSDLYAAKKVRNAFAYLISLVKEKNPIRDEYDPFAPQNFNKHAIEIKGGNKTETIPLTESNGVYKVWIKIGNKQKHFVLDTGASDIAISVNVERELIRDGILKKGYYIQDALYRIADGSIIKCRRFILPSLSIGNYEVKNITFSVGTSGTPLLLGRSFLDKFKKWSINNNNKTLILER